MCYCFSDLAEIMEKSGEEGIPDLAYVMRTLSAENISNLPPGGGLVSKYENSLSVFNFSELSILMCCILMSSTVSRLRKLPWMLLAFWKWIWSRNGQTSSIFRFVAPSGPGFDFLPSLPHPLPIYPNLYFNSKTLLLHFILTPNTYAGCNLNPKLKNH